MLDNDFCTTLEHLLNNAFARSHKKELAGLLCDGILLPTFENEYSKKAINDKREVTMVAYIGYDGQDKYLLTLKFGNKALSKYARGLPVENCIPVNEGAEEIDIDTERKIITIKLN